ncbi:MAG: asparagine--tRNA ligase [Spirochaetaceae bacterium]|jgi:asparaginyl-tRNA synthetase|nr:asparagine--tRNA ligase [Spirochaetaceae bacterium]
MLIKEILKQEASAQEITVSGWVRTKRDMKNFAFIELNDGSCFSSIQCIFERVSGSEEGAVKAGREKIIADISTGCSVEVKGTLVRSPSDGQALEVQGRDIVLLGSAENYPLQKKGHSLEFLREIAHLRARTNTIGAVARIRSRLAFAVHNFFQGRGFQYLTTPLITTQDAEGAGAMFQVTTLNLDELAKAGKAPDYTRDFFGKKAFLTVSGQLEGESYAAALSRIYTFGPTFRAERSDTARHLAEFWMIEPEMSFAHLEDDMALAEDFLKYLCSDLLKNCTDDLEFFNTRVQKGLLGTLQNIADSPFARITYTDALHELEKSKQSFEFTPFWGCDLQSEHERFLTEQIAKGPLIVTDYPKEIKAFYMKANEDGKTVRAMDLLVPRLGEIIGGSEREDNLSLLEQRMEALGMDTAPYRWYLDLRRYGSVAHAGFGLGFERLVQYFTGMTNIRDVIPYPRALAYAEF